MDTNKILGVEISLCNERTLSLLNILNESLEDSNKLNSTNNANKVIHEISTLTRFELTGEEQAVIILWLSNHGQISTKKQVCDSLVRNLKDKKFSERIQLVVN